MMQLWMLWVQVAFSSCVNVCKSLKPQNVVVNFQLFQVIPRDTDDFLRIKKKLKWKSQAIQIKYPN